MNGDKQRQTKRRHVQGMLDETDPLKILEEYCSASARIFVSHCSAVADFAMFRTENRMTDICPFSKNRCFYSRFEK